MTNALILPSLMQIIGCGVDYGRHLLWNPVLSLLVFRGLRVKMSVKGNGEENNVVCVELADWCRIPIRSKRIKCKIQNGEN